MDSPLTKTATFAEISDSPRFENGPADPSTTGQFEVSHTPKKDGRSWYHAPSKAILDSGEDHGLETGGQSTDRMIVLDGVDVAGHTPRVAAPQGLATEQQRVEVGVVCEPAVASMDAPIVRVAVNVLHEEAGDQGRSVAGGQRDVAGRSDGAKILAQLPPVVRDDDEMDGSDTVVHLASEDEDERSLADGNCNNKTDKSFREEAGDGGIERAETAIGDAHRQAAQKGGKRKPAILSLPKNGNARRTSNHPCPPLPPTKNARMRATTTDAPLASSDRNASEPGAKLPRAGHGKLKRMPPLPKFKTRPAAPSRTDLPLQYRWGPGLSDRDVNYLRANAAQRAAAFEEWQRGKAMLRRAEAQRKRRCDV